MKALIFLYTTLALTAPSSAYASPPKSSGESRGDYSSVPKKNGSITSNEGMQRIREEAVTPEEVYKHGVQEVALIASDTGFQPARIYVRRNIPVHLFLTSASPSKLCFVMDDFQIRKGVSIQQVEQVNFMPTKVGEYKFYCPVSDISGSVIVRD